MSKVADGVINWAVFDDYADISAMASAYATAGGGTLSTTASYYYLYQFTNSGPNQLGITYISVDVPDLGLLLSVGWLAGWGFTDDGLNVTTIPDINNPENLGDDSLASPGVPRPGGSVGFVNRGATVLDPAALWLGNHGWYPGSVVWGGAQWIPDSAGCPGCIPDSSLMVIASNAAPGPYDEGAFANGSGWLSDVGQVASLPEPGAGLLLLAGLVALRRTGRRSA
jgi:hypothetical protein